MGGFGLGEVVDHSAVGEGLLYVLVIEINNGVAVRPAFSLNPIIKDDLLLARGVDSLNLAIMAHVLVHYLRVWY